MTDNSINNQNLLVTILEWFKVEIARCEYQSAEIPNATRFTKWLFRPHPSRNTSTIAAAFNRAIEAVRSGDKQRLIAELAETQTLIESFGTSDLIDGESYIHFFQRLLTILEPPANGWLIDSLESLWFDIAHAWRAKSSKGVPRFSDLSKFMIIEWIATIFLICIGVILPAVQSTGIYMLVPVLYMALMCVLMGAAISIRPSLWKWLVVFWIVAGIGYLPAIPLQHVMSSWIVASWSGGVIVGALIGNDVSYKRSRRMATQYGPFARLYARHIHGHVYELMMVTGEGKLAWYYRVSSWWQYVDPCLGGDLSTDLRGDVRTKCGESQPYGGWLVCYPALVATRMEGLRRRNPVDWGEARSSTPDLTPLLIGRFFANPPSLVEPPAEFVALGPTVLPRFKNIPGWGDQAISTQEGTPGIRGWLLRTIGME